MGGRTVRLRRCRDLTAALHIACERDDGANERVTPPLDVSDVAVAKLAITKCLADRGHVDPDAHLLHGLVRPDVIDKHLFCDNLTWAIGKIYQNIQGPTAEGKRLIVAPEYPLANGKFERAEPQLSYEPRRQTCISQK
jgi:hypothetical protein